VHTQLDSPEVARDAASVHFRASITRTDILSQFVLRCGVQLHSQLEIQFGGLQADFDNLKAQLDEETDGAATLRTQLQKSQADYQTLKSKYDKDLSSRSDELDEMRSSCQRYEIHLCTVQ